MDSPSDAASAMNQLLFRAMGLDGNMANHFTQQMAQVLGSDTNLQGMAQYGGANDEDDYIDDDYDEEDDAFGQPGELAPMHAGGLQVNGRMASVDSGFSSSHGINGQYFGSEEAMQNVGFAEASQFTQVAAGQAFGQDHEVSPEALQQALVHLQMNLDDDDDDDDDEYDYDDYDDEDYDDDDEEEEDDGEYYIEDQQNYGQPEVGAYGGDQFQPSADDFGGGNYNAGVEEDNFAAVQAGGDFNVGQAQGQAKIEITPEIIQTLHEMGLIERNEMPMGADLDMIEALLAHMQQNPGAAGGGHMYEDLHDDDDDEDYDDDEEDDDEDDYYPGEQHNINMFQNPYGGAGAGGGGGEVDAGAVSLIQGLLGMSGAGAMGEMGLSGMGGMGNPMDGAGGAFDMNSFLPNMSANVGAAIAGAFGAAASGIMDGIQSPGAGGATIHEYDDDDDDEITEGSGDEDEDEEESEEDDDGHVSGSHMAAMAAMGGLAAGGGIAAMASMMSQSQQPSQQPKPQVMYSSHPQAGPVLPHSSPYVSMNSPNHPMYSPSMAPNSQVPQSSTMSNLAAAAVATAAAAMSMPAPASAPAPPAASVPPTVLAPPMSISSGLGGGTMSRVDPLAALAMGGAAAAMGGSVLGKLVSTVSNNTGGGTALVKSDHLSSAPSVPISAPAMHKSLDELNKISDGLANTRISSRPMPPFNPSMQAAYSHQHLAQMHGAAPSQMPYPPQFMMPGMMVRPAMPPGGHMMPPHSAAAMVAVSTAGAGKANDGDKTSLDRESVPCSETSGGGKSDTESTTKKTPSPTLVGPGRVSPDSSSGASSSGSDRGHVKNATSFASLSDLPSATESNRDSDTDHMEQQIHQLRRLHNMEHEEPMMRANGILMPNAVPMLIESPGYGWSSLVGHENAKDALKNLFQGSKFPEVFDAQGSCRGVLLFGPSGAGKTSLARSLAYEAGGAKLIACTPSFIMNRSLHPQAAAGLIRNMFDHARVHKPCVMLMDEIEMLALPELTEAGKWAKAELMAQVRGETTLKPSYPPNSGNINEGVMLVATTCSPWVLPDELRRLFAYNIHIKLPAEKQREELFRMFLNNYANNVTSDQYKCLLSKSEGYSAADIHTVVRQASYNPPTQQSINTNNQLHQNHPRVVTYDDLASVMTNYRCLYKPEHMSYYKRYIQEATHRTEDMRDEDDKRGKPKGVKKFSRLARSLAAAVISVID